MSDTKKFYYGYIKLLMKYVFLVSWGFLRKFKMFCRKYAEIHFGKPREMENMRSYLLGFCH
jgi:hypothetical protein